MKKPVFTGAGVAIITPFKSTGEVNYEEFGRIIAQTAKHVIRQGIREAERGKLMEEFQSKNQELISAKVLRVDPVTGNATLEIGKNEAVTACYA